MKEIEIKDLLKEYCKDKTECSWAASRNICFLYIKETSKNLKTNIEFRTRKINYKNKNPNIKFHKLKYPVMFNGKEKKWYIMENNSEIKKFCRKNKTYTKKNNTKKDNTKKDTKKEKKNSYNLIFKKLKNCFNETCKHKKLGPKSYKDCIKKNCSEYLEDLSNFKK